MKTTEAAIRDSVFSGALASVATLAAASFLGTKETKSAVGPINAVSHVLWGDEAADARDVSAKHTLTGAAINHAACMFWAVIYEKFFAREESPGESLLGGAAVAALAYVTDYHFVPKRLTPGYELALPPRALFGIYGALAASLGLASILRSRLG
jgi:hypothetical protein